MSVNVSDLVTRERKQPLTLTCIVHHVDVGSQFGAGKVIAVLDRVIEGW